MNGINITLKEYCRLSGESYKSNWAQKKLRNGDILPGMITVEKFGKSYMITVLKTWYNGKI